MELAWFATLSRHCLSLWRRKVDPPSPFQTECRISSGRRVKSNSSCGAGRPGSSERSQGRNLQGRSHTPCQLLDHEERRSQHNKRLRWWRGRHWRSRSLTFRQSLQSFAMFWWNHIPGGQAQHGSAVMRCIRSTRKSLHFKMYVSVVAGRLISFPLKCCRARRR